MFRNGTQHRVDNQNDDDDDEEKLCDKIFFPSTHIFPSSFVVLSRCSLLPCYVVENILHAYFSSIYIIAIALTDIFTYIQPRQGRERGSESRTNTTRKNRKLYFLDTGCIVNVLKIFSLERKMEKFPLFFLIVQRFTHEH